MHQNKGKSISDCLTDRTDYVKNPDKTNDGQLLSSYECDHRTVQGEFMLSKREYDDITGRKQKNNVIAYQIRQSFKPDEIDPETANKIGYELGMSFTKGNHAFIVATHIDKSHIHNHIIFNSTSLDCTKKFRDFLGSGKALAKVSDRICLENGLSIIENPKKTKGNYGKWLKGNQAKKPKTFSDKLKYSIDDALSQNPQNYDDFLNIMRALDYDVKDGKHTAFKSKEQKNFIRLRSLGIGYSQEEIKAVICGQAPKKVIEKTPQQNEKSINLLVDIQAKLQQGKSKGYESWAKVFNLKQMAQTINFLRENNLMEYDKLEEKTNEIINNFDHLTTEIKQMEKKISDIESLKKHIINYVKTKDIYTEYRKAGYSKKFYSKYESEIILHKSCKIAFNELNIKKLPTIKTLNAELYKLKADKNISYTSYKQSKKEKQDILTAKANIDRLLMQNNDEKQKEKSQEQR